MRLAAPAERLVRHVAAGLMLTSLITHPDGVRAMVDGIRGLIPPPPTDSQLALAYLQIWHNR